MYVLLDRKIKEFGDEYVAEQTEAYLADDSDRRDCFDFLNELKR